MSGQLFLAEKGLRALFPYEDDKELEDELLSRYKRLKYDETTGTELCSTLERYFLGERVQFRENIDMTAGRRLKLQFTTCFKLYLTVIQ